MAIKKASASADSGRADQLHGFGRPSRGFRLLFPTLGLLALVGSQSLAQVGIQAAGLTYKEIAPLRGHNFTQGRAINEAGQVAGYSGQLVQGEIDTSSALFWNGTASADAGGVSGDSYAEAEGIRPGSAEVVGTSISDSDEEHGFLRTTGGAIISLTALGGRSSQAHAASDTLIVGEAQRSNGSTRAAAWTLVNNVPQVQELGTLPGGFGSSALAVSGSGLIAGVGDVTVGKNFYEHPIFWGLDRVPVDVMANLPGTLAQFTDGAATGVNDSGVVVGYLTNELDVYQAFVWSNGTLSPLPNLPGGQSRANAVNHGGTIVGVASDNRNAVRAVRWVRGAGGQYALEDLTALLSRKDQEKVELTAATGINGKGQMVANGRLKSDNLFRAFLLAPPAPAGGADMAVESFTGTPEEVKEGETVTYTATARNHGPQAAPGATLVLTFPKSFTIIDNGGGTERTIGSRGRQKKTITFSLGTLSSGNSAAKTVKVTGPDGANPYTILAAVDSQAPDAAPGNDRKTVTTRIRPGVAELELKQLDHPSEATLEESIPLAALVENHGPDAATNVKLVFTFPKSFTVGSSRGGTEGTSGSGASQQKTITFQLGTLTRTGGGGESVKLIASVPGTFRVSVRVYADQDDPGQFVNFKEGNIRVRTVAADVAVATLSYPVQAATGIPIPYQAHFTNYGPDAATNAKLVFTFPSSVTVSDNGGGTEGTSGSGATQQKTITFQLGTVWQNTSFAATVRVTVSAPAKLQFNVRASADQADPRVSNNVIEGLTYVSKVGADVAVTHFSGTPGKVDAGESVTYTATVKNNGPEGAVGAKLVLTFPKSFAITDSGGGTPGTRGRSATLTFNLGALAAGATVDKTVTVRAPSRAGSYSVTAKASAQNDPSAGNNSKQVVTKVR